MKHPPDKIARGTEGAFKEGEEPDDYFRSIDEEKSTDEEKIDESSEDQSSLYGEDIDISDRNKDDAFYYRQIEDDIDNKGMSQNDDNNHDDSEYFEGVPEHSENSEWKENDIDAIFDYEDKPHEPEDSCLDNESDPVTLRIQVEMKTLCISH